MISQEERLENILKQITALLSSPEYQINGATAQALITIQREFLELGDLLTAERRESASKNWHGPV